ncbi:MAG TPA: helix-turn-helix transcriptional regulator [Candidatus Dormibacteraeota bacterium]
MTIHEGTELEKLGRLSRPAVLVLVSLAAGPKHGYGIMQDVRSLDGTQLEPGTLYAVLARLESRGWIEALPVDGRRRPYALTVLGNAVLRRYLTGLKHVADTGLRRLQPLQRALR